MKTIESINSLIDLGLPVILWGPPGVGKSTMIRSIAEKKKVGLIDLRLSQMSPVDLRGIPVPNHDMRRTTWYPPAELPCPERDGEKGILFLDELINSPRDVQAAALQLVLDRRLGEYKVPDGWQIVAASNRVTDKAGAYQIISSLANRFVHIPVACSLPALSLDAEGIDVDFEQWKGWAFEHGVAEEVLAFLNYRQNLIWKPTGQVAYPTPRMWADYVSKIVKNIGLDQRAIAGCIGDGPAAEFIAFCRVKDEMPDPDDIMQGKDVPAPSRPDVTYALCGALAVRVIKNRNRKSAPQVAQNIMNYLKKLPTEFQVLLLKDIFSGKAGKHFISLPEFAKWSEKHKEVFLSA